MHDNDNDATNDDYIVEFEYDANLNIEAMDKFYMYDISFENLSPQDQLKKIKENMLSNPSLMIGIYIDLDLEKKYHAFLRKEQDSLLEYPYARKYYMQKFEKDELKKQQHSQKPQSKIQPKSQIQTQPQQSKPK